MDNANTKYKPFYHLWNDPESYRNKLEHSCIDRVFKVVQHAGLLEEKLPLDYKNLIEKSFTNREWLEKGKYTQKYQTEIGPFFSRLRGEHPTTFVFGQTSECPFVVALHMVRYNGKAVFCINPAPFWFTDTTGQESPTSVWELFVKDELDDSDVKLLGDLNLYIGSFDREELDPESWVHFIRDLRGRIQTLYRELGGTDPEMLGDAIIGYSSLFIAFYGRKLSLRKTNTEKAQIDLQKVKQKIRRILRESTPDIWRTLQKRERGEVHSK